jgi:hypothetical protein
MNNSFATLPWYAAQTTGTQPEDGGMFRRHLTAWIAFGLSALSLIYCGYMFVFWAWVTATPLTPAQLSNAQYRGNAWMGLAGLSLVASIGALAFALSACPRKTSPRDLAD